MDFVFLIKKFYWYIYIVIHKQTFFFIISELLGVARHVGREKLWSKPAQLYVRLSIIPISQQVDHVTSGIIRD